MPNNFILKKVTSIVTKFNTRNPFEICDGLNINIYYKNLGHSVKAFYFYQSRIKNIIINTCNDDINSNMLCAHELGHAILHNDIATSFACLNNAMFDLTRKTELEANLFAAELLISDEVLLELLKEEKTVFAIASELSLPYQLLDFKLGILNKKGYPVSPQNISSSNFLKYL